MHVCSAAQPTRLLCPWDSPGKNTGVGDGHGGLACWSPWDHKELDTTERLNCWEFWLWAFHAAAAAGKSLQLCPTLCNPIDRSPLGSPVPGILQARILEWVAISFSNAWKWKVKVKSLCHVRLLATPWTTAYQVPPSMDFPGKSTGVGCHCLL